MDQSTKRNTARNKSVVHNLINRSLGLPHKFVFSDDRTPTATRLPMELTTVRHVPSSRSESYQVELRHLPGFSYFIPNRIEQSSVSPSHSTHICATESTSNNCLFRRTNQKKNPLLPMNLNSTDGFSDRHHHSKMRDWTNSITINDHYKQCGKSQDRAERRKRNSRSTIGTWSSHAVRRLMRPAETYEGSPNLVRNNLLRKVEVTMPPDANKVFSSTWLDDNNVLLGTKDQQLLLYNITKNSFQSIDTMASSGRHPCINCSGGILAMAPNPSGTLLATCGSDSNNLAVYHLPTLTPLTLGEGAHTSWIFDICWVSDSELFVGSRDGCVSVWQFNVHQLLDEYNTNQQLMHEALDNHTFTPQVVETYDNADHWSCNNTWTRARKGHGEWHTFSNSSAQFTLKENVKVRAVEYDANEHTVVVLCLDGSVNYMDAGSFKMKSSMTLAGESSNTCMAFNQELRALAVGSVNETYVVDERVQSSWVHKVDLSSPTGKYVRSLVFNGPCLSVGTGTGELEFVDVRYFKSNRMDSYHTIYYSNRRKPWDLKSRTYSSELYRIRAPTSRSPLEGALRRSLQSQPALSHLPGGYGSSNSSLGSSRSPHSNVPRLVNGRESVRPEMDDAIDYHSERVDPNEGWRVSGDDSSRGSGLEELDGGRDFERPQLVESSSDVLGLPWPSLKAGPAVHTHCYNSKRTGILMAGGELSMFGYGSFCSLLI